MDEIKDAKLTNWKMDIIKWTIKSYKIEIE